MLKANFRPRIVNNKCIFVKRSLPGKGTITTLQNDEVSPQDILGESLVVAGFSSINLAKKLGVSPRLIENYLQKQIGSKVYKGELLALKTGFLTKKVVIAPTDGILDQLDPVKGELRIKLESKTVPLTAGVYGIIEQVDAQRGEVLIKTLANQIFGLVGSGMERGGVLEILPTTSPLINSSSIKPTMTRHILVGGSLTYGEAIKRAISFGVTGIITGGINLSDYRSISGNISQIGMGSEIGLTLMVTEGFGPIPIGEDLRQMLDAYHGRYVFMDGNSTILTLPSTTADSILTLRKISLPKTSLLRLKPEVHLEDLEMGKKVRIIWPPFMGVQGTIVAIDQVPTTIESGISTFLLTLETRMKKIKVPFTNVELI